MKKSILFLLILLLSVIGTAYTRNIKNSQNTIQQIVDKKADFCKKTIPDTAELNHAKSSNNFFAEEVVYWKSYNSCLRKEISIYLELNYSQESATQIKEYLVQIEPHYIQMFRSIDCVNWPKCPQSGEVFPYIHYFEFLKMLFFDVIKENKNA